MKNFFNTHGKTMESVIGVLFILVAILLVFLAYKYERRKKTNASPMKKMTTLSILSALSVVLYYFIKIPMSAILPFIPSFLDIHFSAVPIYIAGFMFGPLSGTVVAVLRMLAKLPGSTTLGIGELSDFIIGTLTVVVASFIYHRNKTKSGAIKALVASVFVWVAVSVLTNWLIIMPFYITLMDFNTVYGMLRVIPGITESNYMLYYLVIAVIPFNLILATLVSVLTFSIYKRVSIAYDKIEVLDVKYEERKEIK